MKDTSKDHLIISNSHHSDQLVRWTNAFLTDRKAQSLSAKTIRFYAERLDLFIAFCELEHCTNVTDITTDLLRRYMLHLEETHHNPGGIHANYRAVRAFLRWYEAEEEPECWKNPIKRVRAPKLPDLVLEPVELSTVQALVDVCERDFYGQRDKALFLFLVDTGTRAGECLACDLNDVDQIGGAVLIRMGKGGKNRSVFMGSTTRRALRMYLKARPDHYCPALWVTDKGERLTYGGLRQIIRRRSEAAKVETPALHDFRRCFALQCLRNGMDVYSLQKLMGHADLQVLRRYLRQTDADLHAAHQQNSPVDRMKKGR